MKKICIVFLTSAFSFVFIEGGAQEKSSHYKAAEEMLLNMKADKVAENAINSMFQGQIPALPFMQVNKDSVTAFLKRTMSWEAVREDLIEVYMSEFSESELKDISAFYLTPSGKKMAEKQTNIMTKLMQIGQQKMQSHMPEMMNMLPKNNKSSI